MLKAFSSVMRAAVAALRSIVWELIRGADGIARLTARTVAGAVDAVLSLRGGVGGGDAAAEQIEAIADQASQKTDEVKQALSAAAAPQRQASQEEIVIAAAKALTTGREPKGLAGLDEGTKAWLMDLSGLELAVVAKAGREAVKDHFLGFSGLPVAPLHEPTVVREFAPGNPVYDESHFASLPQNVRVRLLANTAFQREAEASYARTRDLLAADASFVVDGEVAPAYRPTMH